MSPVLTSHLETVESKQLEYTLSWSTLSFSPIVEYTIQLAQIDQVSSTNVLHNEMLETLSKSAKTRRIATDNSNRETGERQKVSWRQITVPETVLPRHFVVNSSYTIRPVQTNITYMVRVAAINHYGFSRWSSIGLFSVVGQGQ